LWGYLRDGPRFCALAAADPVPTRGSLYVALAEGDEARRCRGRSLFAAKIPEGELAALQDVTDGGFALGCGRFQRQIAAMAGRGTPAAGVLRVTSA
jgi:hypothetical protein